jgi:TRAP-type C4-dicarboxylate transport system permease small subunit
VTAARLGRFLARAAEAASTVAFAAMFVLFVLGVFMRYALSMPLIWAEELIMVIFLWFVFLTEAFVIEEREQIAFDALYDIAGPRGRQAIRAAAALLIALVFLVSLPLVFDYVAFLWRERTAVLRWRLDLVYSCFVVYWLAVIVRAVAQLARVVGPHWRDHVATVAPDERGNLLG